MNTYFQLLIFVLACSTESASSDEVILPRLPDMYVFRYVPQSRDPFKSADANKTLVSGGTDPGESFTTKAAQQYLDTIIQAIKKELFVEGVSTGDAATRGIALINGVPF